MSIFFIIFLLILVLSVILFIFFLFLFKSEYKISVFSSVFVLVHLIFLFYLFLILILLRGCNNNSNDFTYVAFITSFITSLNYTITIVLLIFVSTFILVSFKDYFVNFFSIDLKKSISNSNYIIITFFDLTLNIYLNLDLIVLIFLYCNLIIFAYNFDYLVFDFSSILKISSIFLIVLKQWKFFKYLFYTSSVNVKLLSFIKLGKDILLIILSFYSPFEFIIPLYLLLDIIPYFEIFSGVYEFFKLIKEIFVKRSKKTKNTLGTDLFLTEIQQIEIIIFICLLYYFNTTIGFFYNDLNGVLFSNMLIYCTSLDVIHSIFVKNLAIKFDVMFGKVCYMSISNYLKSFDSIYLEFICYEYCGLYHSEMYDNFLILDDFYFDFYCF